MIVNRQKFDPPVIDLDAAARSFLCAPEAFIVAMPKASDERGELIVPSLESRRRRLSIGTVIAAGKHTGLTVGDHAMVEAKYAKRVQGLSSGTFKHDGEVWMFGITSPAVQSSYVVHAHHTVLAILGFQPGDFPLALPKDSPILVQNPKPETNARITNHFRKRKGKQVVEGRILMRLFEKWTELPSGLQLIDRYHDRADVGLVLGASSECKLARPGDYVIYQRRGIDGLYPEGDKSLAYIPERAIFARCLP